MQVLQGLVAMPKRSRRWSAKPVLAGSSPAATSNLFFRPRMIPGHQEYLACGRKRNFMAERTSQPLVGERALSQTATVGLSASVLDGSMKPERPSYF